MTILANGDRMGFARLKVVCAKGWGIAANSAGGQAPGRTMVSLLGELRNVGTPLAIAAAVGASLVLSPWAFGIEAPSASITPAGDEGRFRLAQSEIPPTSRPTGESQHLAQAVPVETPVSFSSEQADRGEDRYERACIECHGDDLRGGLNGGAPLRGLNFEQKYANGAPASALFLYTSTLMPPNSPGRYSPSTYADLVAYILKRNGFRAGAPLPSDVDALDYLIVEK